MLYGICYIVLLVLLGPCWGGPMADPHSELADQDFLWGADQYDFAIVMQAMELECFWHFAHVGERFYLNYMDLAVKSIVILRGSLQAATYGSHMVQITVTPFSQFLGTLSSCPLSSCPVLLQVYSSAEQLFINCLAKVQWVTGFGNDRHLSVTVNAPSGIMASAVDDPNGQIAFKAKETGFYQMCFSNFHNRFGSMQIFLNFGVYYDSSAEAQKQKDEAQQKKEEVSQDLNNTLSTIEETSHRVEGYVFHIFRYYNFGRMRRGVDSYLLRSNSRYVTCWSAAQCVVIVLAGYLQLYVLKRLFNTKTTTEADKPRC